MKLANTFLLLLAAFVAVFLQSAFGTRGWLGAQLNVLPALIVFASLSGGIITVALLAVCGGLWFDSLSANPLGISMLPLFLIGFVIHRQRELILRDQFYAQFVLGLAASFFAPLAVLLTLFTMGRNPLVGWGTLWQLLVMAFAGGFLVPMSFKFFALLRRTFFFQPLTQSGFRTDREIRRGRN
ncbi:MAG: hypothetical protein RLZZ350_268 [Verrucomicrobiota bacterium]|jgi:rod shape-determining protein MreD